VLFCEMKSAVSVEWTTLCQNFLMIVSKIGLIRCHILHIKCINFNSNHNSNETLGVLGPIRNRWYVVIDVQGNVRVLLFLLDRVLAFPVNFLKTTLLLLPLKIYLIILKHIKSLILLKKLVFINNFNVFILMFVICFFLF